MSLLPPPPPELVDRGRELVRRVAEGEHAAIELAELCYDMCELEGYTQRQWGEAIGLSQSQVGRYVNLYRDAHPESFDPSGVKSSHAPQPAKQKAAREREAGKRMADRPKVMSGPTHVVPDPDLSACDVSILEHFKKLIPAVVEIMDEMDDEMLDELPPRYLAEIASDLDALELEMKAFRKRISRKQRRNFQKEA